jgi:hypothetical protein
MTMTISAANYSMSVIERTYFSYMCRAAAALVEAAAVNTRNMWQAMS